jgi:hypothetical protein
LTAAITRRAKPVWIAGGIMAILAIATGAAKFAGVDLLAIGGGIWLGLEMCEKPDR